MNSSLQPRMCFCCWPAAAAAAAAAADEDADDDDDEGDYEEDEDAADARRVCKLVGAQRWKLACGRVLGIYDSRLIEYDPSTLAPLGLVVAADELLGKQVPRGGEPTATALTLPPSLLFFS